MVISSNKLGSALMPWFCFYATMVEGTSKIQASAYATPQGIDAVGRCEVLR